MAPTITNYSVLPQAYLDFMIYSPDVFDGVMYLGGWATQANIGPDQIYTSAEGTDNPAPLVWSDGSPYGAYHVNDPSVMQAANGELIMFVTASPNVASNPTTSNYVGLATSSNGGRTWTWGGVVIGQNNGLDSAGAWSPTAVATTGGIDVWYNTNSEEADTGQSIGSMVYLTKMSANGLINEGTTACIDTSTGQALLAGNVDVTRLPDGDYVMVANGNGYVDLVAYRSTDGIHWTPFMGGSDPTIVPANGAAMFTPTIVSATETSITFLYSDLTQGVVLSGAASEQHEATITTGPQPTTNFLVAETTYGDWTSMPVEGEDYSGGTNYLQHAFIDISTANLLITATTPNAFIVSGSGTDALVGNSGHNVLSAGSGSNVMAGGTGIDTFFAEASTVPTWNEIINFHSGDDITIWNVSSSSSVVWHANDGIPGYLGATALITDQSGHTSALTLAGFSVQQAQALIMQFGTEPAGQYMHLSQ